LKLKAVRDEMIRSGLSRPVVNQRIGIVKRAFKWAVGEELVPGAVYHALQAVSGLAKGRTAAREPTPVQPVPDAWVDAALPHVLPPIAALIELQRLTGARAGELIIMRPATWTRSAPSGSTGPPTTRAPNAGRGGPSPSAPRPRPYSVRSFPWTCKRSR